MQTIGVLGLGYIGLPTAATLAQAGYSVRGFDISREVVGTINGGSPHIVEHGLNQLVAEAVRSGRLVASTELAPCDVYIVAVPTPIHPDKTPDLDAVRAATETVVRVLAPGQLVIVESTVPPRTCLDVVLPILESGSGLRHGDFHLAHCPERVLPGRILEELIANDRIVGGVTPEATRGAASLYASFVKGEILETDVTTAEACKLMENTFRDVNIALANELASMCADFGIDAAEAIRLANRHPRVFVHQPGIGVGGHCIPVDPWFLVHAAPAKARLVATARAINDARPERVVDRILALDPSGSARLALLGLAFKPDVDDLRESPAVEIAAAVARARPVVVVEPHIDALPPPLLPCSHIALRELDAAVAECDTLVVLVRHQAFAALVANPPAGKNVIDAAKLW